MVPDDAVSTTGFTVLSVRELDTVSGGFDLSSLANLPFGQIGQSIGGLIDSFKSGSAAQIGGSIGGLIQQFMGMFNGGGQQQQQQPQQQDPQQMQQQAAPQMGGQ